MSNSHADTNPDEIPTKEQEVTRANVLDEWDRKSKSTYMTMKLEPQNIFGIGERVYFVEHNAIQMGIITGVGQRIAEEDSPERVEVRYELNYIPVNKPEDWKGGIAFYGNIEESRLFGSVHCLLIAQKKMFDAVHSGSNEQLVGIKKRLGY